MIEAAAPKDEIEGALAVQMACTHTAAMAVLARFGGGGGSEGRVVALGSAVARLLEPIQPRSRFFDGYATVGTNMFGSSMSTSMMVARPSSEM